MTATNVKRTLNRLNVKFKNVKINLLTVTGIMILATVCRND